MESSENIYEYLLQIDDINEKLSDDIYQSSLKTDKKLVKTFLTGLKKYEGHMNVFEDLPEKEQIKILKEVRLGIFIGYKFIGRIESSIRSYQKEHVEKRPMISKNV